MTVPRWEAVVWPRVDARWVADAYGPAEEEPLVAAIGAKDGVDIVVHVRVDDADPRGFVLTLTLDAGEPRSYPLDDAAGFQAAYISGFIHLDAAKATCIGKHRLSATLTRHGAPVGDPQRWDVLLTLGPPQSPWVPDGHRRRPWARALVAAVDWCAGASCTEGVLSRLRKTVWEGLDRNVTVTRAGSGLATTSTWNLLHLLDTLDAPRPATLGWGCADAAIFLVFFASILGVACQNVYVARPDGAVFSTRSNRELGEASPSIKRRLGYHDVVALGDRIWDPTYEHAEGFAEGLPRRDYLARLVLEPVGFEYYESPTPSWDFSECQPIGTEGAARPGIPEGLTSLLREGRVSVGFGGRPEDEVRSVHVRVYSADDRSVQLVDLLVFDKEGAAADYGRRAAQRWIGRSETLGGPHLSPGRFAVLSRDGRSVVLARGFGRPVEEALLKHILTMNLLG